MDVSFTVCENKSNLSVCLSVKKRVVKKEQKYNQELSQAGSRPSLIPLVLNTMAIRARQQKIT